VFSIPGVILGIVRKRRQATNYGHLANKVVLVTGASSGIGKELSRQLFQNGAKLILASRSENKLLELKEELMTMKSNLPVNMPRLLPLDLEQVEKLAEKSKIAESLWGRVDILINCGGVSVRGGAVETQLSVHRKIMEINYFGALELTRNLVKAMIDRGDGLIVNISSVQGKIAIPHRSAYGASKHALQAFSDSLRTELNKTGVKVLVVSPGYVNTDISKNALTASGSSHNTMDNTTQNGYSVEYVAEQVIISILADDKEVILAPIHHRLVILLRSVVPSIYFFIMNNRN